ncbi:RagB/SusD family nutrient uptake outer membrane protein [Pedobacter puniceum]|uniref:RagB/SusD family nutrient uptake outer membrane protein n=1 Tax=Pedobacter puniceum TaxID=2666136 RepID=A0A7K0FMF2_9SPHI|nr:RagB/SusD family nutrient uptake outer membrane protein [Pedobacter puniceum]MRX47103.1 RagB/SusD family nutrient uptake outer membrane protein [Pedobacter puniceum]
MKKFFIYINIVFLISFTSCEKLLDKDPVDQLSIEDLFKDVSGSKTALAGAYRTLLSIELYHRNLMVLPDLLGGNIKYSRTVNIALDDVYNLAQTANQSSMNTTYSGLYQHLNNVNNIIFYTPSAEGQIAQKNRILAEAKCLRALAHFELLRVFAKPYNTTPDASHLGIALILKPQLITDPLPVRSTAAQSYQAVIQDLLDAITLFENSSPVFSSGAQQTFFSIYAAKALLAKVYLYTNNWDKAYEYADDVIRNGGYSLLTNANYVASWATRTPSVECIFEIALESNFSGSSLGSFYEVTGVGGFRMYAATNDILNLYGSNDIRRSASLFNTVAINNVNYAFTKKYAAGSINATPVKILRLSEIYLIRAEAAAEKVQSNFTQANADLSSIIRRADPTAANTNFSTKTDLIDAILLERRKELAFEGNLLYDLLRKGKNISRVDCNATICSLPFTDNRLVMPIPASTIDVNPNMVQNADY